VFDDVTWPCGATGHRRRRYQKACCISAAQLDQLSRLLLEFRESRHEKLVHRVLILALFVTVFYSTLYVDSVLSLGLYSVLSPIKMAKNIVTKELLYIPFSVRRYRIN